MVGIRRAVVADGGTTALEDVSLFNAVKGLAKVKKPRGRPPRHSAPGAVSVGAGGDQTPRTEPSRNTPNSAGNARPNSYAAFREAAVGPDGQPLPKKRGRPLGWRKNPDGSTNSYSAIRASQPSGLRNVSTVGAGSNAAVVINSRSPSAAPKARGRPAKTQTPSPEPQYQVFKCQWQNCAAELHNLETLRKHVGKLHGKAAAHGGWDCLWKGCGKKVTVRDKVSGQDRIQHQQLDFSDRDRWTEHLETKHFGPLAWTKGDGPAAGVSGTHFQSSIRCNDNITNGDIVDRDSEMSEAYLSDAQGRQVTPRIEAPPRASDQPSSVDRPRGPGRPPKKTEEQKALESQKQAENKKKTIGPGVDTGGSRLANAKRRQGFLDDEDFERVVDDD